jgi:hypothetical protein
MRADPPLNTRSDNLTAGLIDAALALLVNVPAKEVAQSLAMAGVSSRTPVCVIVHPASRRRTARE